MQTLQRQSQEDVIRLNSFLTLWGNHRQRSIVPGNERWFSKGLSWLSSWFPVAQENERSTIASSPRPHALRYNNDMPWHDAYKWIDDDADRALQLLQEEGAAFRRWARKSGCAEDAKALHQEIRACLPDSVTTPPETVGAFEYFVQQTKEAPLPCYMRRKREITNTMSSKHRSPSSQEEEVVLDVNALSTTLNADDIDVGQLKISRCHRYLAFTVNVSEEEDVFACFVRDIATGEMAEQPAFGGVLSVEWAADGVNQAERSDASHDTNKDGEDSSRNEKNSVGTGALPTLLATIPDALGRPYRVVAGPVRLEEVFSSHNWACATAELRILFEERDPRYFVELQRSKDWEYILVNSHSKRGSEVHVVRASAPLGGARCVQPRCDGLEYFVEHHSGHLLIMSNRGVSLQDVDRIQRESMAGDDAGNLLVKAEEEESFAGEYKLFVTDVTDVSLGKTAWKEIIPARDGVCLEDLDVFRSALVLHERDAGRPQRRVIPVDFCGIHATHEKDNPGDDHSNDINSNSKSTEMDDHNKTKVEAMFRMHAERAYVLPFPKWALSLDSGANADFYSDIIRTELSSPIHADVSTDWDLKRRVFTRCVDPNVSVASAADRPAAGDLRELLSDVTSFGDDETTVQDQDGLSCTTEWVKSNWDGGCVSVPVTICQRSPSKKHGTKTPAPCLMIVYAAYGHNVPLHFHPERLPLLRRGWMLCFVHARGGGELGRRWHALGRGKLKPNSARDVLAVCRYLVSKGYTSCGRIAIETASAGAIAACGAVTTMPSFFGAAILESPFVDVLGTLTRPELPLSVHEYDEWGDPSTPDGFEHIQTICPYSNIVEDQKYPPLLITASATDARVPFSGPLKFAAKVRAASPGSNIVDVMADAHAGHLPGDRERHHIKSLEYAWLLKRFAN